MIAILFTNYAMKVLWEVAFTPITYKIVNFLKRAEDVDIFDDHTDFTPFSLRN